MYQLILCTWILRNKSRILQLVFKIKSRLSRHKVCASSPGPRASACVPVKCWVPERERIRVWGWGALGCHRTGASVCASQRSPGPGRGHRRSGRGGLHHGVTPAPGYSARTREQHTQHELLMLTCILYVWTKGLSFVSLLTVQGLTVRALLMNWNCSMPACMEAWGGSTISMSTSTSCSSCCLLSCLIGSTHRW